MLIICEVFCTSHYTVLSNVIMHIGITSWAIYPTQSYRIWSNRANYHSSFAPVNHPFVQHAYLQSKQNVTGAIKVENLIACGMWLHINLVVLLLQIR